MVEQFEQSLDLTLAALSDATRRQLLRDLAQGECSISTMAKPLPLSFESVSKHLRVLERAGLVRRRREGRTHLFSVCSEPLRDVEALLTELRTFWNIRLDNLASEVEAQERAAKAGARRKAQGRTRKRR